MVSTFSFTETKSSLSDFLSRIILQTLGASNNLRRLAVEHWDESPWEISSTSSWGRLLSFWAIICEAAKGARIFWVIDALDECNEPEKIDGFLKSLLQLLNKLNKGTTKGACLRIFFTRRPEVWRRLPLSLPPSRTESESVKRIILEDEAAPERDIQAYIHERVKGFQKNGRIEDHDAQRLEATLCTQAGRSFIWVTLTLTSIKGHLEYGDGDWDAVINGIPSTLEETYGKL